MSIASEITRIAGLRDTIRTKLIDFGIITDSTAKLSACSEAIDGISEASLTVPSLSIASNPTIDNSTGLVSVSGNASGTVSASEGYSKGLSKSISVPASGSLQLATQAAQTITPGTSNKTIAANRWLTGAQTIKGDSNLVAANIKSGASIFGVSGSMTKAVTITTGHVVSSTTTTKFNTALDGSSSSSKYTITITVPNVSKLVGYTADGYYRSALVDITTYNGVRYGVIEMNASSRPGIYYVPLNSNTLIMPMDKSGLGRDYYVFTSV